MMATVWLPAAPPAAAIGGCPGAKVACGTRCVDREQCPAAAPPAGGAAAPAAVAPPSAPAATTATSGAPAAAAAAAAAAVERERRSAPEPAPVEPARPEPAAAERPRDRPGAGARQRPGGWHPKPKPPAARPPAAPPRPSTAPDPAALAAAQGRWVSVRGGTFTLGRATGRLAAGVRRVRVEPFAITVAPVTVRQYRACQETGGCSLPAADDRVTWNHPGLEDHPVTGVTWQQARAFCRFVGADLPTEAQFDLVALGPTPGRPYPWGAAPPPPPPASAGGDHAPGTRRVCDDAGMRSPDGLCDLVGNTREWLRDAFHPSLERAPFGDGPYDAGAPDPNGKVVRGAAWFDGPEDQTAWSRRSAPADLASPGVGFRCVRDATSALGADLAAP
jgi:formylglycine-generating enzyme required for sulfatase activity